MQVPHPDTEFEEVVGEVFGHLLGQRRHQHAFIALGTVADLVDQIVDLPLRRLHHDLRIDQPGRADHLLDELSVGLAEFVRARRRGQIDRLPDTTDELVPGERAVVDRRG